MLRNDVIADISKGDSIANTFWPDHPFRPSTAALKHRKYESFSKPKNSKPRNGYALGAYCIQIVCNLIVS